MNAQALPIGPTHASTAAMLDALDPLPAVEQTTGLSRPTIYRMVKARTFPAPVKCGSASRWLRSEVQRWICERVAERDAGATA